MAHPIERELIKAASYKSRTKFDDRQDYLSSILNAVMKLTDDDFDNLSDDAATWVNAAVEAHNSKNDMPDFDEVEVVAEDTDAEDEESEDAHDTSDSDDTESDDVDDDVADLDDDDDADADDDDPEKDDAPEDEAEADEDEPAPPAKKKTSVARPAKTGKGSVGKPDVKAEKPAKAPVKQLRRKSDDDVVLDQWGCMEGSKNSRALAMFAKGATAKEVKDDLGGTYYNILKRMVQAGHILEKNGAVIKLINKDDKAKKAPAKAPVKKPKK